MTPLASGQAKDKEYDIESETSMTRMITLFVLNVRVLNGCLTPYLFAPTNFVRREKADLHWQRNRRRC
jgi:hypothetical protein